MSKVLLDEMDKNDQLIGEVYSKGDVLLQVISGKTKATVESELNQLEEDWAEFCQDALAVKAVTEQTIQMWNEFDENRDKLAEWLGELERAYAEAFIGPANLEALREEMEKNKVRYNRTFATLETRKELQWRIAHVRCIKILTWLWGFLVIFLYLVWFSLCSILFWELRDNGVVKKLQFCP